MSRHIATCALRSLLPLATLAAWATPARAAPEKFSLSMFHFNVQYVAGGLVGFPDGETAMPGFDLDDDDVQDLIIVESFEPLLDLLLAHPTWKLTFEMQGYMVEVMRQRHPLILDKLRQLVADGQVELVSFHYSDQLFLAYPRLDMVRSHELLDAVIAENGLTLSPVVFCQEGQMGEGVAPVAAAHGQTILGLPKNLLRFQHLSTYDSAPPLFDLDGSDVVVIGRGMDASELAVTWSFFGDGELLATNGLAPYLGPDFVHDPEAVAEYEQKLSDQEAQGYQIATIEEMVAYVKENDLGQEPLPPLLDGTWQPPSTESMFQWMGRSGAIDAIVDCERDNEVLTANYRARHMIAATETLLAWARDRSLAADDEYPDGLRECWRSALLGQVTDSSGINPFINEVDYGRDHAAVATECASAIATELARREGSPWLSVNTLTGEVTPLDARPAEPFSPTAPLLTEADGFSVDAPARDVAVSWERMDGVEGLSRVTLAFSAARNGSRFMEVTFPFELDELRLTPGLIEGEVRHYPLSAFDLQEGKITLPLSNGLVGLREGLWLIKDTSMVHVGLRYQEGEATVAFQDETVGSDSPALWRFYLFEGDEAAALAQAERINLYPTLLIMGAQPAPETGGCGCATSRPGSYPLPLLALGVLLSCWLVRRRHR